MTRTLKADVKVSSIKLEVLGTASLKTRKGEGRGYLTAILYLASGVDVCALAKIAGCLKGCLRTSGKGALDSVQSARERKTADLFADRDAFLAAVARDIRKLQRYAEHLELTLVVRLNGTSDLPWELWAIEGARNIFALFPDVQFYDYTKVPTRKHAVTEANYHLTFSYSHQPAFQPIVAKAMQTYGQDVNLAVVFEGDLPATFLGRDVVSGDDDDLRFLDRKGVVVGLTAKRVRGDLEGFAVPA